MKGLSITGDEYMTKADDLLDVVADHYIEIDKLISDNQEAYGLRVSELLVDSTQRDDGIFEQLDVPVDIIISDLENVQVFDRDINWVKLFADILAACRMQAWVELMGYKVVELIETGGKNINNSAKGMTKEEFKESSTKNDLKKRMALKRELKYGLK
jgi:hypothetical protein